MTDLYIVFDDQQDAQEVVDEVNLLVGFPNGVTQTVAEVNPGGSKWYVLIASEFPPEWFAGFSRLTKAEAMAAGVVFE
jgi:hypothetical protein